MIKIFFSNHYVYFIKKASIKKSFKYLYNSLSRVFYLKSINLAGETNFNVNSVLIRLVLLFQTFLVRLFTLIVHFNSWFSYMFFLILIRGLLILIIYVTKNASTKTFNLKLRINLIFVYILTYNKALFSF